MDQGLLGKSSTSAPSSLLVKGRMERIRDTAVLQLQPLFNLMYSIKEKVFWIKKGQLTFGPRQSLWETSWELLVLWILMQLRGEWTISNQPPGNMEYKCCTGVHLRLSVTYTGVELNNVSACFTIWMVTFLNSIPS